MTTSYPIVAQQELGDAVKRGPLGFGRRRNSSEIPKIKPHEVLVWRVGSRFVVDERRLQATDEIAVGASSVSVVSVRPSTAVEVPFLIDSQDAAKFTVKVTFVCSVLDPVVVVRDGQVDAAEALLAYLQGYQDLFAVGLEYPLSEINAVRTVMTAQVRSYLALRPPKIPGIEITSATVQVETPDALGKISDINHRTQIQLAERYGEALIDEQRQTHILRKKAQMGDSVGRDPRDALDLAYADGGMTSQEYAERARQLDEAEQRERVAREGREYAVRDRDAGWAHDERTTELEWHRKQIEDKRREAREDRRSRVEANLRLLNIFGEHGHLDTYNADIEDLIKRVRGDHAEPGVTAGDRPAELTDGRAPEPREPGDDNDN